MKKLLLIFLPVLLVFGSSVGSFAVPEDRSVQIVTDVDCDGRTTLHDAMNVLDFLRRVADGHYYEDYDVYRDGKNNMRDFVTVLKATVQNGAVPAEGSFSDPIHLFVRGKWSPDMDSATFEICVSHLYDNGLSAAFFAVAVPENYRIADFRLAGGRKNDSAETYLSEDGRRLDCVWMNTDDPIIGDSGVIAKVEVEAHGRFDRDFSIDIIPDGDVFSFFTAEVYTLMRGAVQIPGIIPEGYFPSDVTEKQYGDWSYMSVVLVDAEADSSGHYSFITKYHGDDEIVIVPDEIDGAPVVCLTDGAFCLHNEMKGVYIPKSVEAIGEDAFFGARALRTVWFGGFYGEWREMAVAAGNDDLLRAKVYFGSEPSMASQFFLSADVNDDAEINSRDVIAVMRAVVNLEFDIFPAADVNGDGKLNAKDVVRLMKYLIFLG